MQALADQEAAADSAYVGEKTDTELKKRGFLPLISEKGYKNKPQTEEQKALNKVKSSVRCRVEHVFGEQKMRMSDEIMRSIGLAQAKFWIGMRNEEFDVQYASLREFEPSSSRRKMCENCLTPRADGMPRPPARRNAKDEKDGAC